MPMRRMTLNEALKAAVQACGGAKVVGCAMWPTKHWKTAETRVDNILDTQRRAHFSDDEIDFLRAWCKRIGAIDPWSGWEAKYDCELRQLDPSVLVAELQTRAVELAQEAARLNSDLAAIGDISVETLARMTAANPKVTE